MGRAQILSGAKDDSSAEVNAYGGKPSHYISSTTGMTSKILSLIK